MRKWQSAKWSIKLNIKHLIPPVIVPFLLIVSIASTVRAQLIQDSAGTVPYKDVTPRVETTIDKTAIIALRHIVQARSDIHRRAFATARRDLTEAARLMDSIRDDLSPSTAKNLIGIARLHLGYERSAQVLHDLPLIYSSLEMVGYSFPTDKAKMHLDRAKGYLERDVKQGTDRELALADKSLIVIEVELPLLRAQHYVTKARGVSCQQ